LISLRRRGEHSPVVVCLVVAVAIPVAGVPNTRVAVAVGGAAGEAHMPVKPVALTTVAFDRKSGRDAGGKYDAGLWNGHTGHVQAAVRVGTLIAAFTSIVPALLAQVASGVTAATVTPLIS